MKKLTAIILAFAMLLSLCACGVGGGSSNQFVARINYTENSGITVTPDVLSSEYKTSDTFAVTIDADTKILDSDGNAIDQSFLTAGLEVVISFDGIIDSADPPRITAEKIELRNGVVSGTPAPQTEDTVTFTEDGEAESVKADRVGLKGCYILVPQEDWLSKSAQDTQVGPLIIYPTASENSTLTFRVYVNESASSVRELLTKQHKRFFLEDLDNLRGKYFGCSAGGRCIQRRIFCGLYSPDRIGRRVPAVPLPGGPAEQLGRQTCADSFNPCGKIE
jgi:hypothetical protein